MTEPVPPGDFDGKVAIVTGGGTGLGKAMALAMAKRGAQLVVASRNPENLQVAVNEIAAIEGAAPAVSVQTDVRNVEQVEQLMSQTVERFGKIDVLINNAAGNFAVPSEKLTPNGWNAVVGIVLNGTWFCSSAAGKQMIQQGSGCILNIIATYAWTGAPGVVHSASAKAGVLAMTRTLAAEWGQYGIRVNALAPGVMVTDAASKNLGFATEEIQEKLKKKIPVKRLTSPEEIAEVAVFLCSDKAGYITGDAITADGGFWLSGRSFLELV